MKLVADGVTDLSPRILLMSSDKPTELGSINPRVEAIDAEIKALAKTDADMQRLMEIPGVGSTIASALVAAVGTGSSFTKGRNLAAWLGWWPRQITTSGNAKLIGISKHGNRYLRKLFNHGARTVLHLVRHRSLLINQWADGLKERAHLLHLVSDQKINRSTALALEFCYFSSNIETANVARERLHRTGTNNDTQSGIRRSDNSFLA